MVVDLDFVLLMHRDEVFKPTNSGRLIADLFPSNTYAFQWSRTDPAPALLTLLADTARFPVVIFPPGEDCARRVYTSRPRVGNHQKLTLVLLDGTWKQARKMYKTSRWLQALPLMVLPESLAGHYAVRHAATAGQLATAEAAAELLLLCKEPSAAQLLSDYFAIFNQHYVATRMNQQPTHSGHHQRLQQRIRPASAEGFV